MSEGIISKPGRSGAMKINQGHEDNCTCYACMNERIEFMEVAAIQANMELPHWMLHQLYARDHKIKQLEEELRIAKDERDQWEISAKISNNNLLRQINTVSDQGVSTDTAQPSEPTV